MSSLKIESLPLTRIESITGWRALNLRELWVYRELLYILILREVGVRYKQTILGAAWAILQPCLTLLVFTLVFGRLAKLPSEGIPYPLFAFAALVPWNFFSNSLTNSANSVVVSATLITKLYFPRLLLPIAAVLSGLIDFALAFLVLIAMIIYYRFPLTANIFWLPLFLLLAVVCATGTGMWLSALNVEYRDIRHTVPFLTQFWMFATPIVYSSSLLHEPWRTLYGLNPMVGVVEGFRWSLLSTGTKPNGIIFLSSVVALLTLVSGAFYFKRIEKRFADVV
jgi:lipopolysaccharide transport system permease protein